MGVITLLKKFSLKYCGIEETDEIDCTGMTEEEIQKELVQWVLERVDHWTEEVDTDGQV